MPSELSCVGWNTTVFAKNKVDWKRLWTNRQVVLFRRHRSQVSPMEVSPVETPWFPTPLPSYVGPLEVYPVTGFFWHGLLHKTIFSFSSFPLLFPSTPSESWSFLNSHSNSKESKQNRVSPTWVKLRIYWVSVVQLGIQHLTSFMLNFFNYTMRVSCL